MQPLYYSNILKIFNFENLITDLIRKPISSSIILNQTIFSNKENGNISDSGVLLVGPSGEFAT